MRYLPLFVGCALIGPLDDRCPAGCRAPIDIEAFIAGAIDQRRVAVALIDDPPLLVRAPVVVALVNGSTLRRGAGVILQDQSAILVDDFIVTCAQVGDGPLLAGQTITGILIRPRPDFAGRYQWSRRFFWRCPAY